MNNKQELAWQPEIYNNAKKIIKQKKVLAVVDDYEEQLKELFAINNPTEVYKPDFPMLFAKYLNGLKTKTKLQDQGKWVYFPWNGHVVHILDDKEFQRVRTARNRNLITEAQQQKFYNSTIGIAGLSVGNSVALALVLQGGAKNIRLADFDRLALSNLNRIRAGVTGLGELKVKITARQIYELNPYAKIEIFPEGITKENIAKFFTGLDIVIDEIDSMGVKYLIRQEAQKRKIPVLMGADNGDNAIIDIERYDKKPVPKPFHDRLGNTSYQALSNLNKFEIGKTITQFLGAENITAEMQDSLLEMGKTIVSWPQLGGAALLNGLGVAYCARKVLNNEDLESNRAVLSLDEKLIPNYFSKTEKTKRQKRTKQFKKIFGLK